MAVRSCCQDRALQCVLADHHIMGDDVWWRCVLCPQLVSLLEAVNWLELLNLGRGTCVLADEDACGFVDADPYDMDNR